MRTHSCRAGGTTAFLISLAVLLAPASARADGPDKLPGSLRLVPADALFYSAMLRNAEQWKAITGSKAWEKLTTLESVAPFWKMAQAWMEAKENRQLLGLLGDMTGQEIFFYGGPAYGELVELLQTMAGAMQGGPALARLGGGGSGDPIKDRLVPALHILMEQRDKIKAPGLLIGFRVENPKEAEAQLKKAEEFLGNLAEQVPLLKGSFKRQQTGKASYLTLALDGEMVPWKDLIPWKQFEDEAGQFDPLIRRLYSLKLTVSAGIRDNYMLLCLDETSDLLGKLGGEKSLASRDELKPLARFADQRLTSISYTSKGLAARTATTKEDIDGTFKFLESLLQPLGLKERELKQIHKDIAELGKELKASLPEPGASLHFSFVTERGSESYSHDWTRSPRQQKPQTLPILEHLGGDPLLAVVERSGTSLEDYRSLMKWVRTADGYIEQLVLPRLEEGPREQVEQALKTFRPLLRQLDDVTAKMFLPALADGQVALVIDARLKSKRWIKALGATDKALPLLEPALVLGVTDAALLQKALGAYRQTINKILKEVRELAGPGAPDLQIPAAKLRKTESGTFYSHAIAEVLGLDEQIELTAGIGEKFAVFGLSKPMAERLLTPTPLKAGGPLAKVKDRPLLSAAYVNWEGMTRTVAPWVELAAEQLMERFVDEDDKAKRAAIRNQVKTGLELLTVFRSHASITYMEDKAQVTHGETIVRDLEK